MALLTQIRILYPQIFKFIDWIMDIADENSPQAINQTYKIWKKNVPFLYNSFQSFQLPSCSQTVEWLPQKYVLDSWEVNYLVIGSNSVIKNNLSVVEVKLPTDDSPVDYSTYRELINKNQQNTIGTMGQQVLNITKKFPQNSEIMKVRSFKGPNRKGEFLAVSVGGSAPMYYVCDLGQDPEVVNDNKIVLEGHEAEGFGLAWHPTNQFSLVTGAFDGKLCIWDIQNKGSSAQPTSVMDNNSPVEDVKWCQKNQNIIGSGCQDKSVNLWDIREKSTKPVMTQQAHNGEVYTVDFNNFTEHLLLTGGEDHDIILWDTRNMNKSLHTFIGHNDLVTCVKWSQINPYTFTSSSFDRRTVVWDMHKSNKQNEMVDEDNESNQIKFIHGGHRSKITDFCWNQENKVCASVQENNMLHVWEMNAKLQQS